MDYIILSSRLRVNYTSENLYAPEAHILKYFKICAIIKQNKPRKYNDTFEKFKKRRCFRIARKRIFGFIHRASMIESSVT